MTTGHLPVTVDAVRKFAMKADERQSKICFATATTADFLPGTLVTVGSFLKHHPDVDVDVAIIHDGLDERQRASLAALSDRVRFVSVSSELRERLARVGTALPRFAPILSHLHALEAYRLTGYRKLLLCDGDLLFREPVGELFASEDALLCSGDLVYLSERCRDAATFALLDDPAHAGPAGAFDRTFNDGLLCIDAGLVGERTYTDLLSMVRAETWHDTDTSHFKQFLHTRYFHSRHTLVSSTYNFVLRHAGLILTREGLTARDAKVLHFNLRVKPWMLAAMLRQDVRTRAGPAFDLWYDAWTECLSAAHLRTAWRLDRAAAEGGGAKRTVRCSSTASPSSMNQVRPVHMKRGEAFFATSRDIKSVVRTHVFVIAPNNSGSTFLMQVLATCRQTWNLLLEGQFAFGFTGPNTRDHGRLLWSLRPWRDRFTDPAAYDWSRNRTAWYFQAFARDPQASVFVTKAPPFLLQVGALRRHFRNAKFLFTARNPYAVCEGIHRYRTGQPLPPDMDYFEAAAEHVVNCLALQRDNLETHGSRGVFFTYEEMCAEPARVERQIRSLVPALGDLKLRQKLAVKRLYDEMLTNMNARQIARLTPGQIGIINRVFRRRGDVLDYFGYEIMEPPVGNVGRPDAEGTAATAPSPGAIPRPA